ncbi:dienelactone hydrolase family protein [Pseudomonas fluorescens]|uniref:Dienelactone hydrolase family protein n=1 Tax=Pseudomonas fluorescens TaxID=294 RepID=A0AAE2U189_PSEFL|nr:dienelactone hydrolase family protein [Pseudomonas fluorescens]MBD8150853.1 dienelactone hydrolase family protein [Pseudomonas fluorescens]MBD8179565.1 dienelactone hydrolase family protein [Pseudomonas fluorescens]MBD8269466.1 dienelactone hydrolase family protein [Pseudomonas fluorescens]MBD8748100.1 dienelactone hydrolase family protein [Pseudomonas fluorescens]MBD8752711.1 dienelactone hydrolase family protein [Pseudomonas fluorescens]
MLKQLALALALVAGAAHADNGLHTDLPLSYLEQTQDDARNQPLVIFLHGFGSNEEDLFGIKDALPSTWTYLSVRAPLPVEPRGYRWFTKTDEPEYNGQTDELSSSARLIKDFVVKATAKYHTQSDRVFLVGFSQGAIMSYEVGLRRPELLRGIAALSGSVLPVLKAELKPNDALGKLAIFIGHGTLDQALPYALGTRAHEVLEGIGLKPEFHGYAGMNHTISEAEVQDLKAWLEKSLR